MVTKLFGRPQSLSSTILSGIHFFPKSSLAKPVTLCLISSSPAATTTTTTTTAPILTLAKTLDTKLSYGPSLHQSAKPIKYQNHQSVPAILEEECVINEEAFTRVFNLTAIRVPSKDCFNLENRLRGHLLNWPRIRNIARVPGDEVEDGLVKLLGMENNSSDRSDNEGDYASLNRRIHGKAEGDGELLSPVLYRDRLAKTFDSQGFVKFRNLAKLSRPKKKRRKEEERGKDKKRTDKNHFAKVEVVEDEEEGNDLRGLLGEEFKNKRWTGSTRLLLLDHRYGDKGLEELPDAIKVAVPIFC